ncbi:MAG: transposase [Pirellulaceae bacterium]
MSASQPHRKQIRHYEGVPHLHELTFSTYRRIPLLTNDPWRRILAKELNAACEAEQYGLVAFVFMPEHVHLLVLPQHDLPRVSQLLGRTKRQTSIEIKEILVKHRSPLLKRLTVRERPDRTCFRFWQEGPGFDRNLYSPKAIEASINYIHRNPVQRGLCRRAIDWKWSSARYYVEGVEDPDLPRLTKLDPTWFRQFGIVMKFP